MQVTILAVQAYNRMLRRTSKDKVIDDWNNELDFKVNGGSYFSKRDSENLKSDGFKLVCVSFINEIGNFDSTYIEL